MAEENQEIDRVDRAILGALQNDGRLSWRELAEQIHLSPTSTADRVRRLEQRGVIKGYRAVIDPVGLGRDLRAVIDVSLPPTLVPEEFEAILAERPEVTFAAFVTGTSDYTIVADCEGADGLNDLIRWLKARGGVARTESRVVLRNVVG
jgi:Lrp/AsnC family transcriptional regulator, leucine-responsive regulatory protein